MPSNDLTRALSALRYSPHLTGFTLEAATGHSLATELHREHASVYAAYHHGVFFLERRQIKIAVRPDWYTRLHALHPAWHSRGRWDFGRKDTTMFLWVDDDMAREHRDLLIELIAEGVDWRSRGRARPGRLPDRDAA